MKPTTNNKQQTTRGKNFLLALIFHKRQTIIPIKTSTPTIHADREKERAIAITPKAIANREMNFAIPGNLGVADLSLRLGRELKFAITNIKATKTNPAKTLG